MHLTLHLGEGTEGQTFGWANVVITLFLCVLGQGPPCPNTQK